MRKTYSLIVLACLLVGLSGCRQEDKTAQMCYLSAPDALIYPDYTDCFIPVNIAPMNFYILPAHKSYRLKLYAEDADDTLFLKGRNKVCFPAASWHRFLSSHRGRLRVEIELKGAADLRRIGFSWTVCDSIDPYFSCRLIEPSYQTSALLQSIEYSLENAEQRLLFDNRLQEVGCVNCHTYAQTDGDYLVYHVRFDRTGTFIVNPDRVVRVNLKSKRFPQGGVYPAWHPDKNVIAFGTSSAYPFVHSKDIVRRTEVYDSIGDIILYDIKRNYIFSDTRLVGTNSEETFPYWSWDGKWLYFCQSPNPEREAEEDDVDFSQKIHYNLLRIAYHAESQTFGEIDTLIYTALCGGTVSFPRLSPDGRFLVFCLSDHGTFPIRHPESDLYILNLGDSLPGFANREGFAFPVKKMENVNSAFTESYHTFSSNGRWLMFSSKREDNLYSRPYFTYVDEKGVSHKPFLLPQRDPAMYLGFLKSFNVPEFSNKPIRISAAKANDYSLMPVKTPDSIVIR